MEHRETSRRLAEQLRDLSASERNEVLARVDALLRNSGEPLLLRRTSNCSAAGATLLLLLLLLPTFMNSHAALHGTSTSQPAIRSEWMPKRFPIGPQALEESSRCVPKVDAHAIEARDMEKGNLLSTHIGAYERIERRQSSYPSHAAFDHPQDALRKVRAGHWNSSQFPLLLCVGHGKTGTKSLNKAFVMLGLSTAHFYGAGIYGLLHDNAAEATQPFMFNVHESKHVDAVLDTPVVDFYHEIRLSYPQSKVILTVREPQSWLRSQQKFYSRFARGCRNWLEPWRRGSNLVYGTECPSKEQAIKRYVQHNRNVYDQVDPTRLLVMDIPAGDGWHKLCPFLGLKPPKCPPTNLTQCRKAGVESCAFPSRH